MMARCIRKKNRRFAFYGAMMTKDLSFSIWAAAAIKYSNGSYENLAQTMNNNLCTIVNFICNDWMGRLGPFLLIGRVAAPVT
jgi:hypothetical protein